MDPGLPLVLSLPFLHPSHLCLQLQGRQAAHLVLVLHLDHLAPQKYLPVGASGYPSVCLTTIVCSVSLRTSQGLSCTRYSYRAELIGHHHYISQSGVLCDSLTAGIKVLFCGP